jgi:biopolymer transport protein ExbB
MLKHILENGGIIVYGIMFLSIIGFGVILERGIYFLKNERHSGAILLNHLEKHMIDGQKEKAVAVCNGFKNSSAAVIKEIIKEYESCSIRGCNYEFLEEKARESALREMPKLEKNMWILGIAAHVTPLVGLFGTVTGMIQAFMAISTNGAGDPTIIAKGISQALITTATGLGVAIPALIFHNFYSKKIEEILHNMEKNAVEFINFLRKQRCRNEIKKVF